MKPKRQSKANGIIDGRKCAAFQLGYLSRIAGSSYVSNYDFKDKLAKAILVLVDVLPPHVYFDLQRILDGFRTCFELSSYVSEEMLDGRYSLAIATGDRHSFSQLCETLQSLADQSVDSASPYRYLFDLGVYLGESTSTAAVTSNLNDACDSLQEWAQELPANIVNQFPTLVWIREFNPESAQPGAVEARTGWRMVVAAIEANGHTTPATQDEPRGTEVMVNLICALESEAANAMIDGVAPVSVIPPQYRTKPMTYREAAVALGMPDSQDGAELVSKDVKSGRLRCEHFSRQRHVFDKRQLQSSQATRPNST